jgi:hypothetical protein
MGHIVQTSLDMVQERVRRVRKQIETTYEDDI